MNRLLTERSSVENFEKEMEKQASKQKSCSKKGKSFFFWSLKCMNMFPRA